MKILYIRSLGVGLAVSALSTCGSSGGDGAGSVAEPIAFIAPGNLPTTGFATYTDDVGIVINEGGADNLTLNGELSLNVTFAGAGTVTGGVENFTDSNSASYSGSFTLANGDIDRSAPATEFTLFAELDGAITRDGDGVSYETDGDSATLGGDFFGTLGAATPEQIRGDFRGGFNRMDGATTTRAVIEETESTFTAEQ